ncbi:MAG TPA: class I SAM-dependent methyltransferase [Acidimicrobiales bacterium]|jgi:SAM-dependent methyltransferase
MTPDGRPDPDPGQWADPRPTYDLVATRYADTFIDELSHKPFDRDLLDRFAAAVTGRSTVEVPVCDLGCGPGHIGAYLAGHQLPVTGIDLSPAMVAEAGRRFQGLSFRPGDMTALPVDHSSYSAIVTFYAIIHMPRPVVPNALAEMHRALIEGDELLLAAHEGAGTLHADVMLEQPVSLDATLFALDELVELVEGAGFAIREAHQRAPYEEEQPTERLYVWAVRRP